MNNLLRELITDSTNPISETYCHYELCSTESYLEVLEAKFECERAFEAIDQFDSIFNGIVQIENLPVSLENGKVILANLNILENILGLEQTLALPAPDSSKTDKTDTVEKSKNFFIRLWKGIVKIFKAISDKIKGFYRKLYDNNDKLSKDVEKVSEIIDELIKKKAKTSKQTILINLENLIAKDQSVKNLNENFTNLGKELDVFVNDKTVINEFEKVDKYFQGFNLSDENERKASKKIIQNMYKVYHGLLATKGSGYIPEDLKTKYNEVTKSAILPGNKALYSIKNIFLKVTQTNLSTGKKSTAWEILQGGSYKMDEYTKDNNSKGRQDINVLPLSDLSTLADIVKMISKLVAQYQNNQKRIDRYRKELEESGEKVLKNVDKIEKEIDKMAESDKKSMYISVHNSLYGIAKIYKWMGKSLDFPAFYLNSLAITASRGLLVMTNDMVKVYK